MLRFHPQRERPIHLSQFPILAAMPKRFGNDCETSELFRLGSIILYLRLHGTYSGRPVQRLTCTCKPTNEELLIPTPEFPSVASRCLNYQNSVSREAVPALMVSASFDCSAGRPTRRCQQQRAGTCHPQTGRAADDRPDHPYPKSWRLAEMRDTAGEQRFARAR